ncbi:interferon gamma receptor 2 isoform X2 [Brachyhypopomus gauderio]|uniref:interferon gamma receptor 2 isoform X2 n=1 Tax=Brachyhypopomus gauderio TaxID=698409 RepID=UPI0040427A78
MDQQSLFVCLFFLVIRRVWLTELAAPPHIEIRSSVLRWDSPRDTNVTFSVQYSTVPVGLWHSMTGCSLLHCDFPGEQFYGKVFRVRAERGTLSSVWQQSEQVHCAHIDTCAPLITLTITTDKVGLSMKHRDSSLKKEYGGHITFKPLYWKTTNPNDIQEPDDITNPLIIWGLESGKNYCFQVEYLTYNKPYGHPSLICEEIPEKSADRTFRIIISGVVTVLVLAILGCSFYFVYNYYRKIKQHLHRYLEAPLDIPDHFHKFLSSEFSEDQVDHPSSQDEEVCDFISLEQAQLEPEVVGKG